MMPGLIIYLFNDLSVVNLGHYKGSADLMETMFMCGQVVPVENMVKLGKSNGIKLTLTVF